MRRLFWLTSVVSILISVTQTNAQTLPQFDQLFLQNEARTAAYEVALAQLAQGRATRPAVKAYADTLLQDHTQQDAALQALAAKKGVTLRGGLLPQRQATLDRIGRTHGSAFDAAFLAEARRVNSTEMRAFRAEASRTTDPDIRQFVSDALATDTRHADQARQAGPQRGMPVITPPAGGRMPILPPPAGGTTPVIPPPR